jgi:hypothetical protein
MADEKSKAELDKLKLEIRLLKREKNWLWLLKLPFITAIVAAAGLAATVWQIERADLAQVEERKARTENEQQERINRIQNQIRTDKEQLTEFGNDPKISAVRAGFLINDLKSLIEQLPKEKSQNPAEKKEPDDATSAVTWLLHDVAWNLSFSGRREIDFDVATLKWPELREFWIRNQGSHQLFLAQKYHSQLSRLKDEDRSCLEMLDYVKETKILTYDKTDKRCNQELIDALIYGLGTHLTVMKNANQPLTNEIKNLTELVNQAFAQKLQSRL